MMKWIYLEIFLFLTFCSFQDCNGEDPCDIDRINTKILELENELLRLKGSLCGYDQEVKDIKRLKETSQQTEEAVNELRDDLLELSRRPNIAFRSVLSKNLDEVKEGTVIVFDQVDLNSGDAYNRHNGIFVAPYNGTYIFSMSLANPAGKHGVFYLVQSRGNNSAVLEYTIAGHTTGWNMGGVTTTTELTAGESVYVEGQGNARGSHSTDRHHTTFSGILVHKY